MINNLPEQSAEQSNRSDSEIETTDVTTTIQTTGAPQYVEVNEAEDLFEPSEINGANVISENSESAHDDGFRSPADAVDFNESPFGSSAEAFGETNGATANRAEANFRPIETSIIETESAASKSEAFVENRSGTANFIRPSAAVDPGMPPAETQTISKTIDEPQSFAETARQSGLAYAAAITLFASVVFMLIVGWFADLLFGSSPWGKVVGIIVGSLIGFVQLFRITSQIFKDKS